jgi:histidyl-tRNA synthetase
LNSVGCRECRPAFNTALRERLKTHAAKLCENCQRRAGTNPLRVLDCKVPEDQAVIDSLPSILDYLCPACSEHFASVRRRLDELGIRYSMRPRLVRGLDYYMRTTFEFVHGALGAQNSVLGGGRYDGLAEDLGSKVHSPGIGFSIGEDRLVMSIEETSPAAHQHVLDLYIAPVGEAAHHHCAGLAHALRRTAAVVEVGSDVKLKKAMELANKLGARQVLLVGENEMAAGRYELKDMATGEQVAVTRDELLARFNN